MFSFARCRAAWFRSNCWKQLDVARVVQVLLGEALVDHLGLAPVGAQVALRLFERRVAAVAWGDEIELRLLDNREVAGCGCIERIRIVRLDQRAFGAARMAGKLVHLDAKVIEHDPGRLLDERETRGDGAPPEDRELLVHARRLSVSPGVAAEKTKDARHSPRGPRRASLLVES